MNYVIAIGGLIGTCMVAMSLFGMEFVYPRWKRWLVLIVDLCLAGTFWVVRPVVWNGASVCDPRDGGMFDPSC